MNRREAEARKYCAFCNFSWDCEDCSYRDWPSGNRLISSQFNWKKCQEWRLYLGEIKKSRLRAIKDIFESLFKHG